jgi:hypothetical protein
LKNGIRNLLDSKCEGGSQKEILKLEEKLETVVHIINLNPEFFSKSERTRVSKALMDKNNYLVYRKNKEKNRIEIINLRGTRQRPVH